MTCAELSSTWKELLYCPLTHLRHSMLKLLNWILVFVRLGVMADTSGGRIPWSHESQVGQTVI